MLAVYSPSSGPCAAGFRARDGGAEVGFRVAASKQVLGRARHPTLVALLVAAAARGRAIEQANTPIGRAG